MTRPSAEPQPRASFRGTAKNFLKLAASGAITNRAQEAGPAGGEFFPPNRNRFPACLLQEESLGFHRSRGESWVAPGTPASCPPKSVDRRLPLVVVKRSLPLKVARLFPHPKPANQGDTPPGDLEQGPTEKVAGSKGTQKCLWWPEVMSSSMTREREWASGFQRPNLEGVQVLPLSSSLYRRNQS